MLGFFPQHQCCSEKHSGLFDGSSISHGCVYVCSRATLEAAAAKKDPHLPTVEDLKWRVDVTISTRCIMPCVCLSMSSHTLFYPCFVCSFFLFFTSNTVNDLVIKLTGKGLLATIHSTNININHWIDGIKSEPYCFFCAVLWPGPCSHRFWCRWNCRTAARSVSRYFKTAFIVTFFKKILMTDLFLTNWNSVLELSAILNKQRVMLRIVTSHSFVFVSQHNTVTEKVLSSGHKCFHQSAA